MKTIGVRVAPSQIRFALVERLDGSFTLLNADGENRLTWPADVSALQQRVEWAYDELARVLRQNPGTASVSIKVPEYTQKRTKSTRAVDCLEGAVILAAAKAKVPLADYIYAQLATKRAKVCQDAEARVGRTATAWDEQMADAVVAAWKSLL